jgi:hypothetical protein
MHYVAGVTEHAAPGEPHDELARRLDELRRRDQRPPWADFTIAYEVGQHGHARVRIAIGMSFAVDIDAQTVTIDDPRLPFTVEGNMSDGRLAGLHLRTRPMIDEEHRNAALWRQVDAIRAESKAFETLAKALLSGAEPPDVEAATEQHDRALAEWSARGDEWRRLPMGEITQKHLRSIALVSLVKQWAAVAREYQAACLEHWRNGEDVDDGLFHDILLHSGDEEALRATREAVARFAASRPYRRATTPEENEDVLRRVVEAYKDAVERGVRAPRAAVAERLSYHPGHVGRLLALARERGMLPPAKPRGRHKKPDGS